MSNRYEHVYTIAFIIVSSDPAGIDVSPASVRVAIDNRLLRLSDAELLEAIGTPLESAFVGVAAKEGA